MLDIYIKFLGKFHDQEKGFTFYWYEIAIHLNGDLIYLNNEYKCTTPIRDYNMTNLSIN